MALNKAFLIVNIHILLLRKGNTVQSKKKLFYTCVIYFLFIFVFPSGLREGKFKTLEKNGKYKNHFRILFIYLFDILNINIF